MIRIKEWFKQFLPPTSGLSLVMDGDLPKADNFKNDFSPKLSAQDGEIHTVIAGRMIGISDTDLKVFVNNNIHIHLYTENYYNDRARENIQRFRIAPNHFHVHPHVSADNWTKELSQYDAGWLHCLKSNNGGDQLKMLWDDMNIPARISTYASAGLPVILYDNTGHIVATQDIATKLDIGIFFKDVQELSTKLKDRIRMQQLTENMIHNRKLFSFDYYVPQLIQLFRDIIKMKI